MRLQSMIAEDGSTIYINTETVFCVSPHATGGQGNGHGHGQGPPTDVPDVARVVGSGGIAILQGTPAAVAELLASTVDGPEG